jgi:hypothetical protein
VIEHKKIRAVHVGNHLTPLFEGELTIRYQIQEMLHIEKIFDEEAFRGNSRLICRPFWMEVI